MATELADDPVRVVPALAGVSAGFALVTTALFGSLALFLYWHPYYSVLHDSVFYSLNAINYLEPGTVSNDAFLRHGSQGNLTIFTLIYAQVVSAIGLQHAAYLVTRLGSLALFAAVLLLVRQLMPARLAWLAFALCMTIPGRYGAQHVFRYDEDFATPRPYAEALVLLSVALSLSRRPRLALVLIGLALALHPLMAMPGVLLWVWLNCPTKYQPRLVVAGIAGAALVLTVGRFAPGSLFGWMDTQWLKIVEDFTPYVLTTTWSLADLQSASAALATLTCATLLPLTPAARRIALATMAVGTAGLMLTAIACRYAPAAIVIQGQAWRWMWTATLAGVLLLVPVGEALWSRGAAGRATLALLAVAWGAVEDPLGVPAALTAVVLVILLARGSQPPVTTLALVGGIAAVAFETGVVQVSGVAGEVQIALATVAIWVVVTMTSSGTVRAAAVLGVAASCAFQIADSLTDRRAPVSYLRLYDDAGYRSFASWRERIPPNSIVFYAKDLNLVWLMLHRPSYANFVAVVFSRQSALEYDHEYSDFERITNTSRRHAAAPSDLSILSRAQLREACITPEIDFVVTESKFDIPRLASKDAYPRAGLLLYSCADVRKAWSL